MTVLKLKIILVGKDRADPIIEAASDYLQRLKRYASVDLLEVREEPLKKGRAVADVQRVEAERIRKVIDPGARTIALDERGRAQTSVELSTQVQRWVDEGATICLFIGGPSGLHPGLVKEAHDVWRLSHFTLPHRVARLLVCEQMYRAFTIIRGEPYHK